MKLHKLAEELRKYSTSALIGALYRVIAKAIYDNNHKIVFYELGTIGDAWALNILVSNNNGPEWKQFLKSVESAIDHWFATRRAHFVVQIEITSNDEDVPPKTMIKGPSVSMKI